MTILDKLGTVSAAAKVMALNFWPWLLGAAVLGAVPAAYLTFQVTRAVYQREALQARLDLSNFTGALATSAADGQARARQQLADAHADMDRWRSGIEARLDRGFAAVANQWSRDVTQLRESINAPAFDCLRVPYPADSLRLLSRPGGAIASGGGEDPGAPAPAGRVPPASAGPAP